MLFCTHIVFPDVRVVFSEHLQARREALHEATAAVVADACAPGGAGEAQEQQQDGEQRAASHSDGPLEKVSEGGGRVSKVHAFKLIPNLIYSPKSGRSLTGLNFGDFFFPDVHPL